METTLSNLFPRLLKGSTPKKKHLLSVGANNFSLDVIPFQKELWYAGKLNVSKVVSSSNDGKYATVHVSSPFKSS